jgi:hypothetical protein
MICHLGLDATISKTMNLIPAPIGAAIFATVGESVMPSMISGVYRKLQWKDFKVVEAPPAGVPAGAVAQTITSHTALGGLPLKTSPPGSPAIFQVPDTLAITITFDSASWRLASVSQWSGKDQVWLIKHEQGHYDINALFVRDFFHRVQAMVGQPFFDANMLKDQLLAHRAATIGRISATQDAYDRDTENSRNGSEQWAWWSAIERAGQLHRTPIIVGPDGRYLRVELADALVKAGLG